ncbi:hypothetical protein HZY62_08360 [Maribacter polysiphoniae]|uniref:Uncharacterized protein n=1 Tax=Maribacter polysiphoniae TaxID=429344 RepID=A0A316E3Z7_9FLAO|nr:hypothetical protein [Maribacter polysiphoniae]MBD1260599.1 hypothetical protein [Maribacter polysiphoniae]PWK24272.1 hypothetical protein LX92_01862 [Maribacter polysiphoniae]
MKKFEVYKNIRKRAMIFGLPISLFALMMVFIVASLLVIIFSFGLGIILGAFILNCCLYIVLIRLAKNPQPIQLTHPFPKIITNKKATLFDYEKD